jgi:hypothetical protein
MGGQKLHRIAFGGGFVERRKNSNAIGTPRVTISPTSNSSRW